MALSAHMSKAWAVFPGIGPQQQKATANILLFQIKMNEYLLLS